MGLCRTVSEINGDFSRESHAFPPPAYFAPPLKRFPFELGISAEGQKTRMMALPGRPRSLTISSVLWIQCTNMIDGRTDTGRQQRPRLRIALRGKNQFYFSWSYSKNKKRGIFETHRILLETVGLRERPMVTMVH